jgi:Zn-finger nucleic acid-binding protein
MKCSACGAALSPRSLICPFCGTRNELDLRGLSPVTGRPPREPRACPECRVGMDSINVGHRERFFIERCASCRGLFFDLNELQALLDDAVAPTYEINFLMLTAIENESPVPRRRPGYVPCPECGKLMNSMRFGERSGVVVDRCRDHGLWLQGGELKRLMEWKRAGGQVLDRQVTAREARARELMAELTAGPGSRRDLRLLDQLLRGINED